MAKEQDLKLTELAALTEELGLYDTPTEKDRYKHTLYEACQMMHDMVEGDPTGHPLHELFKMHDWLLWRLDTWDSESDSLYDKAVHTLVLAALADFDHWLCKFQSEYRTAGGGSL